MQIKLLVFWLGIVVMPLVASSQATASVSAQRTDLQALSQTKTWKKLLGFNNNNHSAITSKEFFLSPVGNKDSYAELLATLESFRTPKEIGDQHPQCRFPARYLWLSSQIDFRAEGITSVYCPEYQQFSANQQAHSISIIFATGYLGNPASYYGHLLLKINSPRDSLTTSLENTAVNFGANVPPNENMLIYIGKGIFGGYDSSFTHQQYYYHSHNYGESELRDLWEYELDLEPEALNLIIAHLWELMGADYTYYFFNRNCAYRMGDILELVTEERLVTDRRLWETPQAIMQRLGESSYRSRPLVKNIYYHPSRQSKLYQRYQQLSKNEQQLLHKLVSGQVTLDGAWPESIDQLRQFAVVDTLIDYYQFVRDEKAGSNDINNERYRQVLAKRYQLPPGGADTSFTSANRPHLGRKPSYASIGVASNEVSGESLAIHLRPAYYDALDAGYGHIKNGSLSMAEFKLGTRAGKFFIKDISALKIENISRNYTGLPGDRRGSWYLELGAEQAKFNCTDCLSTKARAGYGYAASLWGDQMMLAGFVGGGFLGQNMHSDGAYLSATTLMNIHVSRIASLQLSMETQYFQHSITQDIYKATARVAITEQHDIRAYFAQKESEEFGISMGFYW